MIAKKRGRAPGVTLKDVWAYYSSYNKSVNEITRQIAYAGIAIIWVFRVTASNQIHVPKGLFIAGFFIGLALFLDYLQYIVGSMIYERFGTRMEKKIKTDDEEFQEPEELLRPMDALFYAKIVAVLAGYIFIMKFLVDNLLAP
jgi:hypothetical protein